MRPYSALMLAIALLVATACARAVPAVTAPTQSVPSSATMVPPQLPAAANATPTHAVVPTVEPTLPPKPLNVKVKLDDKLSATMVISMAGGILSTKGADGTKFMLTVPEGALAEDEEITLTPVTAVDGSPFSGGLVGAVQMAPEGLHFAKPATLVIESPGEVTAPGFETVSFSAHGDGSEFHLYPSSVQGFKIGLEIMHFSSSGSMKGTAAEISSQKKEHPPTSSRDRFEQDRAIDKNNAAVEKLFLKNWYLELEPTLDKASGNETLLNAAIDNFLDWLFQVRNSGLTKEFAGEIDIGFGLLANGTVNAVNKSYDRCVDNKDPKQISNLFIWIQTAKITGIWDYIDGTTASSFEAKLRKCATFELNFDSKITETAQGYGYSYHVQTKMFLNGFDDSTAQAPLEYTDAHWTADTGGCTFDVKTAASVFTVVSRTFALNKKPVITIDPGMPSETLLLSCPGAPSQTSTTHAWREYFGQLHGGNFLVKDWVLGGSGTFWARKTYSLTGKGPSGQAVHEDTILELWHTPR